MHSTFVVMRRELASYFASSLAYVFITHLSGTGRWPYLLHGRVAGAGSGEPRQLLHLASLALSFPDPGRGDAVVGRGTQDRHGRACCLTLPVSPTAAVIGKFLAAWLFIGLALVLTFPVWITVNWLGNPDNGVILAAYIGSWLMAGAFLAISAAVSALTKNQVIAFVGAAAVCFLFLMSGLDLVQGIFRGWAPEAIVAGIASMSLLTNFQQIAEGVIELRTFIFFASLMALGLFVNTQVVELKRGA